ncbi:MAG: hypothetical protein ACKOB7_01920 [Methylocystis sp.]
MRLVILLTALLGIFAFWAWFLIFKETPDNKISHLLEGRAKGEIVDACNHAAAEAGRSERFDPRDVRIEKLNEKTLQSGVVTMVSILTVVHENAQCRWDGEGPAHIYP